MSKAHCSLPIGCLAKCEGPGFTSLF